MYPGSQRVKVNQDKTPKRFAGEITASGPVTSDARTFQIHKPDACAHTKQVEVTWGTLDVCILDSSLGETIFRTLLRQESDAFRFEGSIIR